MSLAVRGVLHSKQLEDKNPNDQKGWTPLYYAAANGHYNLCKYIILNIDDKNPPDVEGDTPHHMMPTSNYSVILEANTR